MDVDAPTHGPLRGVFEGVLYDAMTRGRMASDVAGLGPGTVAAIAVVASNTPTPTRRSSPLRTTHLIVNTSDGPVRKLGAKPPTPARGLRWASRLRRVCESDARRRAR